MAKRWIERWRQLAFAGAAVALVGCGAGCDMLKKRGSKDEDPDPVVVDKATAVGGAQEDEAKPIEVESADSFTGTWTTGWGPVTLTQQGDKLTGSYSGQFRGTLSGTVDGNVADLAWVQTNGERGRAKFTLSADGNSFTGTWGAYSSSAGGGSWNGKRKM
ncbi:MAG: hypothetical protein JRI23_33895 [Deltaproteobacteria bacterium]|nr:hypothetical protein [Deltaproteobacteria bacterium]MBW2537286.1 hypothetical protein [Deltaproteobacteria bacterium]